MTTRRFDVTAIGNAIVDVIAQAEDSLLAQHHLPKGAMNLIDAATAEKLYAIMGPGKEASGGSAGLRSASARDPITLPNCHTTAATTNAPATKPRPAPAVNVRAAAFIDLCEVEPGWRTPSTGHLEDHIAGVCRAPTCYDARSNVRRSPPVRRSSAAAGAVMWSSTMRKGRSGASSRIIDIDTL